MEFSVWPVQAYALESGTWSWELGKESKAELVLGAGSAAGVGGAGASAGASAGARCWY